MRKYHLIIITTFFLALFLPLVFANTESGRIDKDENRYLADFPTVFDTDYHILPGIRDGLEKWIHDNVGGRSWAVLGNKYLNYHLFHQYPDPRIIIGNDNWMYIIYDGTWESYLDPRPISEKKIRNYRNHLKDINRKLNKIDIEFVVVLWPYKHEIYPENIIGYQPNFGFEPAISQLDRELSHDKQFYFSTPYDELLEEKRVRLVYSEIGDRYHWNNAGAFIGYTHLMTAVQAHLPDIKYYKLEDYRISETKHETKYLWGLTNQEEDLEYELIHIRHATQDQEFFNRIPFDSHDPWDAYKYFRNSNQDLPSAVVIGDSYTNSFFIEDMAESFYELVFLDRYDISMIPLMIQQINPDIIICAGLGQESLDAYLKLEEVLQ